jgi:hypothetical protein
MFEAQQSNRRFLNGSSFLFIFFVSDRIFHSCLFYDLRVILSNYSDYIHTGSVSHVICTVIRDYQLTLTNTNFATGIVLHVNPFFLRCEQLWMWARFDVFFPYSSSYYSIYLQDWLHECRYYLQSNMKIWEIQQYSSKYNSEYTRLIFHILYTCRVSNSGCSANNICSHVIVSH